MAKKKKAAKKAAKKDKAKKPAKAKKAKKAKKPRPAPSSGGQPNIAFICSECYEEFSLTRSAMDETLTCPECLHVGKRPEEDFLRTVGMHKAGEKRALSAAAGSFFLMVVCLFGLTYSLTPQGGGDTLLYAFGALSVVFLVLGLLLGVKYEKNRWEVYF